MRIRVTLALSLVVLLVAGCTAREAPPSGSAATTAAPVTSGPVQVQLPPTTTGPATARVNPLHPVDAVLHGTAGSVAFVRVVIPTLPHNSSADLATRVHVDVAAGSDPALLVLAGPVVVFDSWSGTQHVATAMAYDKQFIQVAASTNATRDQRAGVPVGRQTGSNYDAWSREVFWIVGSTRPWQATVHVEPGSLGVRTRDGVVAYVSSNVTSLPDAVLSSPGLTFATANWTTSGPVANGDIRTLSLAAQAPGWSRVDVRTPPTATQGDQAAGNDSCSIHWADGKRQDYGAPLAPGAPGLTGVGSPRFDRFDDGKGSLALTCDFSGATHQHDVLLAHVPLADGVLEPGVLYDGFDSSP